MYHMIALAAHNDKIVQSSLQSIWPKLLPMSRDTKNQRFIDVWNILVMVNYWLAKQQKFGCFYKDYFIKQS